MIIKVSCGNVFDRYNYDVADTDTIRSLMIRATEEHGTCFGFGRNTLNDITLPANLESEQYDRTFADFGITDSCYLVNGKSPDGGTF